MVNAAEGGLQQLLNLIIAVGVHRLFGWGRAVDHIDTKLLSFVLVSIGLVLSTM